MFIRDPRTDMEFEVEGFEFPATDDSGALEIDPEGQYEVHLSGVELVALLAIARVE